MNPFWASVCALEPGGVIRRPLLTETQIFTFRSYVSSRINRARAHRITVSFDRATNEAVFECRPFSVDRVLNAEHLRILSKVDAGEAISQREYQAVEAPLTSWKLRAAAATVEDEPEQDEPSSSDQNSYNDEYL